MSSPAIVRSKRDAWLAERRNHIGASDVAAILGVDPYRGPLAVYLSKIGHLDQEDTRWQRWGRLVEKAIGEGYSYETERPIEDLGAFEIQRHPDAPFLGATLDLFTAGSVANPDPFGRTLRTEKSGGPLECKAVAGFKARDWRDDPPLHFQVQLQAQLACTGAQWGCLVALIGGVALAWRDLQRDDAFLAVALPKLEAFWMKVQRREPPEADGLPGTSEAIRALWAREDGTTVELDDDALRHVSEWEAAKDRRDAAEQQKVSHENELRRLLGEASFGALPDGSLLSLRLQKRGAYAVKETAFRVMRRIHPRLRRR